MGSEVQFSHIPLGANFPSGPHEFDIREEIERDKIFCCDAMQGCISFCMHVFLFTSAFELHLLLNTVCYPK